MRPLGPLCAPLMRADLHVHSSASDGTDRPAEVMRRAALAGLDVVALTDHDTVAGHAEARAAARPVALLPGMELSCRLDGRSLHMLAYLFDPGQPILAAELARIRDDRVLRARAMVDRLADLGVDVSWEQVAAIAGQAVVCPAAHRPRDGGQRRHRLAPRGVHPRLDRRRRPRLRGPVRARSGPRDRPGTGGRRRHGAGPPAGGPGHPGDGRADHPAGRRGTRPASEVFHPDQSDAERARLLALASDLGQVATGGSDDHGSLTGYRLGTETTSAGAYQDLLARVPGSPA